MLYVAVKCELLLTMTSISDPSRSLKVKLIIVSGGPLVLIINCITSRGASSFWKWRCRCWRYHVWTFTLVYAGQIKHFVKCCTFLSYMYAIYIYVYMYAYVCLYMSYIYMYVYVCPYSYSYIIIYLTIYSYIRMHMGYR